MGVFRARASCPLCNTEEEVWFYNGNIVPIDTSQCIKCGLVYNPADFITSYLELRNNVTVSTKEVVSSTNM